MAQRPGQIQGDLRLLLRVPKSALIDYLSTADNVDPQHLQEVLLQTIGGQAPAGRPALPELSLTQLIRVFEACLQQPEDVARCLYEQHRYRGMKSLYLYECRPLERDLVPDSNELNRILSDPEAQQHLAHWNPSIRDLRIRDLEVVVGPRGLTFVEVSYAYVVPVQIVEPRTEYPMPVDDLRFGFLWLCPPQGWAAVCARDEGISFVLVEALEAHLGLVFSRMPIPKSVLQQIQPRENIRRATTYDPSTGTRRRWANELLANDPEAMEEFLHRDEHDERPASGYTEHLPDGGTFALGYSNDRGKLFFSRDLTVQEMRVWGPSKIWSLVSAVRDLRRDNPTAVVEAVSDQILRRLTSEVKGAVVHLTSALANCKQNNVSEAPLAADVLSLFQALGSNWSRPLFMVNCELCEEPVDIQCDGCGGHSFVITDEAVLCEACGTLLDPRHVKCRDGHYTVVPHVADCVYLIPLSNTLKSVAELLRASIGEVFDSRHEFFYVKGSRLIYNPRQARVVCSLEDLPEFARLILPVASEVEHTLIRNAIPHFREKCRGISTENCAGCVANRRHPKCFLRLFGLLDPDYTPRPHHGQEFGDYSKAVTLDGENATLVIMMKAVDRLATRELRLRDSLGRDIMSQFAQYRHDGLIDVIGLFVPRTIEDGFRALIKLDAKQSAKRVLFLEEDQVVQIIYSAMRARNLTLDQL